MTYLKNKSSFFVVLKTIMGVRVGGGAAIWKLSWKDKIWAIVFLQASLTWDQNFGTYKNVDANFWVKIKID